MIRPRPAALGAALLTLALAAAPARAQVFNPATFTLDNGLTVVVVENHRAPIVTHMLWYFVGAADEPPGKSGIAHFLEHLMFKGTERRAPGEFSQLVARHGGRENAFTSLDYTGYFQTVAADRLGLVMELEADRMANLKLTEELATPELQVVLEERRQRTEATPQGLLSEQVGATTWMNHPYGIPVVGWENEIASLTLADAMAFYRTWYAPNNAALIVVGDVTADAVRALAEEHYGPIPARAVPPRLRPQEPKQHAPRRVVLRDEQVQQPSWTRRYIAPGYDDALSESGQDRAYALDVLAELLGGGTTSRLYTALVEEQKLAASVGAWYSPGSLDLTTFGFWLTPLPAVPLVEAEAALEAELARVVAEGVTEEEVARAKQRMLDGTAFALDGNRAAARSFGAALSIGRTVDDVEAWPDRIAAVTVADVAAAARDVLVERNATTGVLLPKEAG